MVDMTLYTDDSAIKAHAAAVAGRAARRKSRKIWALSGLGVALAGGAAFAAVQLFGYGTINQGPASLKDLVVANARLTNSLVPGKTASGQVDAGNQNDFDVVATAVIIKDSSLSSSGADCDSSTLTLGGSAVSYPGGGSGHQIALAAPVTIPAGQARTLTVPNVVSQASTATGLCGVHGDFAVVAQVGN
jgi:hypothetical protein